MYLLHRKGEWCLPLALLRRWSRDGKQQGQREASRMWRNLITRTSAACEPPVWAKDCFLRMPPFPLMSALSVPTCFQRIRCAEYSGRGQLWVTAAEVFHSPAAEWEQLKASPWGKRSVLGRDAEPKGSTGSMMLEGGILAVGCVDGR